VFAWLHDIKGNQKSGRSFFKNDLFFIEPDQFYLYKKCSTWNTHDRYCFVRPIKALDSHIMKPFTHEPLMGEMVYPNEYLLTQGVKAGDLVCFKPDSEYEFTVDEEKLYRMFDHQITIIL